MPLSTLQPVLPLKVPSAAKAIVASPVAATDPEGPVYDTRFQDPSSVAPEGGVTVVVVPPELESEPQAARRSAASATRANRTGRRR